MDSNEGVCKKHQLDLLPLFTSFYCPACQEEEEEMEEEITEDLEVEPEEEEQDPT